MKTCGPSACHAAGTTTQLDMVSPGLPERLVDEAASSMDCAGEVFVATDGTPSLLLSKLEDNPPCGSKMPLIGTLSSVQKQCFTDWVVSLGGSAPAGSGM